MCITDLFQNKSLAYFSPKWNTFQQVFNCISPLCFRNFLVQTLRQFKKLFNHCFWPQNLLRKPQIPFFFPYTPDCPNGPNRGIPVPKCGLLTNCIYNWGSGTLKNLEISFYLFVATRVWNSRAIFQSIKPFCIAICKTVSTTAVQITLQIIPFGFYTSIILVLKNGGMIVSVRLFSFYFGGSNLVWFCN